MDGGGRWRMTNALHGNRAWKMEARRDRKE